MVLVLLSLQKSTEKERSWRASIDIISILLAFMAYRVTGWAQTYGYPSLSITPIAVLSPLRGNR